MNLSQRTAGPQKRGTRSNCYICHLLIRRCAFPGIVPNVCIKVSQKDRGLVSLNLLQSITNFFHESGYNFLEFRKYTCVKH